MDLRIYEVNAAYFLTPNTVTPTTIDRLEIPLVNQVVPTTDQTKITFQGSGEQLIVYRSTGLELEITAHSWPLTAIARLFDADEVTTGLPADEQGRSFFGDNSQSTAIAGLEIYAQAIDDTTSATYPVKMVVPVATLSPINMPGAKTGDKAEMKLSASAKRTAKDITNTAITGLAAGKKCTWYLVRLDP